jgi:uncharacterized protein (TIGR00645 family)
MALKKKPSIETHFEQALFASRWLMAPMYLCLVVSLVILTVIFVRETVEMLPKVLEMSADEGILSILTLIDLSLAGNLMLLVIFTGYENFVSKLDLDDAKDRPNWMGKVDFSGLKLKLISSVVAISGIHLLKVFMEMGHVAETGTGHGPSTETLHSMVIVHLAFVVSGVLLALMDYISHKTPSH